MRLNILEKRFSIFRDTLSECVANNTLKAKLNVSLLNNFLLGSSPSRREVEPFKQHFVMTKLKVSSLQTIFRDILNKKHTIIQLYNYTNTHKLYKHTQIIQTHTNTHKLYKHTNYTNTHNYTNTQLYKLYLTIIILTNNPLVIQEGPDPGSV